MVNLAFSDTTMRTSFVASNLTDVVSVEGGREHSYAIKSNGDVYSTGNNVKGQLGTGDVTRYDSWVKSTMKGAEKISSDARFGLSLKDGKVWFTGENAYGISGDGSSANVSIWREIKRNSA